jgi:hypothetical protein
MPYSPRSTLAALLIASLVACQSSAPQPLPSSHPARALGTVEVVIDSTIKSARATFTPLSNGSLRPQATLDESQFTLTPSSFAVIQTASRRFFNARFGVKNASSASVNNLTLVAYVKNGNRADTAIKNAQNFVGAGLDLDAYVRDVRPAHGVNNDTSVNSSLADLMLLSEAETATLQTEAQTASALQSGEYLLPYGYVARNAANGRTITVDAMTASGAVNIGLNVPSGNDPSGAAYRFSMTFVLFENPTASTRVVQSLEEQGSNATVSSRVGETGATEVVLLQGSDYPSGAQSLKVLCDVRTVGTAAAPGAVLVASSTLAVGQSLQVAGSSAATRCIKQDTGTGEYIAVPTNLASSGSQSVSSTASNIVAATVTPYAARPRLQTQSLASESFIEQRPLRENLDALLSRSNSRITARASVASTGVRPQAITPGVPAIGDQWTLNVAQGCSGVLDERVGTVKAVSDHLIVVADNANPAGGFTDAQYGLIATTGGTGMGDSTYGFDEDAYDAVVNAFGAPTDLDNNGRIIAFFTRAVNELSPPASSAFTTGYFTNRDLFENTVSGCPRSNRGEIIYMMVPDPTGAVNSNVRTVSFVAGSAVRTLGAEFQRLINASRRTYITGASNFEEDWLDDGLSSIAEELMFYQNSVGLAPLGNIQLSNLTTGPNASRRVAAFNTFVNPNFTRYRPYLQRPDIRSLYTIGTTTDGLGGRGAIWNFLRYAADRKLSSGSQHAFWSALVDASTTGRTNLQAAMGANLNDWVRDWSTAVYAEDAVVGAGSEFTNASWNYRSVFGGLGGFPMLYRSLSNNVALTLSYVAGGSSHNRFAIADGTTATLLLRSGNAAPPSSVAMTLMRVR